MLCSATDPESLLGEVLRVLKPRGRYHFLEHVISADPRVIRWQRQLDKIHQRVACGCSLTRDSVALIEAAGFEIMKCSPLDSMPGISQAVYPYVRGVAVRPE